MCSTHYVVCSPSANANFRIYNVMYTYVSEGDVSGIVRIIEILDTVTSATNVFLLVMPTLYHLH